MTVEAVVAGLTGLGAIVVFGTLIKQNRSKVTEVRKEKQDRRACDEIVKRMEANLKRGTDRFDAVEGKVDELGEKASHLSESMATIMERTKWIVDEIKKNGT